MSRLVIDLHKTIAQHVCMGNSETTLVFHVAGCPAFSIDSVAEGMTSDDEMGTLGSDWVDNGQGRAVFVE